MSLTDIMSGAGLAFYAEVAIVIFLVVWLAATIHIFSRRRTAEYDAAGRLPLDDHAPTPPTTETSPRRGEE